MLFFHCVGTNLILGFGFFRCSKRLDLSIEFGLFFLKKAQGKTCFFREGKKPHFSFEAIKTSQSCMDSETKTGCRNVTDHFQHPNVLLWKANGFVLIRICEAWKTYRKATDY